jgi:hypothetical protein
MSLLQDAIASSGADCLWIWHTHVSRNAQAKEVIGASIPQTELIRLRRSLNVILKLEVDDQDRRSVLVEWARNGKGGIRLIDEVGGWRGMPEKLEAAIYAEGVKTGTEKPASFGGPEEAIAWGFEQGCFRAPQHARNAYDELKRERQPKTAPEFWPLWVTEVERRVSEKKTELETV